MTTLADRRLKRIGRVLADTPTCLTCRRRPFVVVMPGDPEPPATCSACGAEISPAVVRFITREDGPQ